MADMRTRPQRIAESALDAELYREQLDQSRQADYRNAAAQREQGRREGGKDAFRSLQHADYVARGGGEYQPKAGTPGYGFGPRKSSTSEIAAAELFRAEQEARLKAGDSLLPRSTIRVDMKSMNHC